MMAQLEIQQRRQPSTRQRDVKQRHDADQQR
jgi:hypothetical protein